jgi:hypothetical protein
MSPSVEVEFGLREQWSPGEIAWFEYHCFESPSSVDAALWYHSHQKVEVLAEAVTDAWAGSTYLERAEACMLKVYCLRFADGFEGEAFEDELLIDPSWYERPDPPAAPKF